MVRWIAVLSTTASWLWPRITWEMLNNQPPKVVGLVRNALAPRPG
jgi:hypothetical protein